MMHMRRMSCALGALLLTVVLPAPAFAGNKKTETVKTCKGGTMAVSEAEKAIIRLHNAYRADAGLGRLCVNRKLTKSARFHSREEIKHDYYAHCSKDENGNCYRSWFERIRDFGFDGFYCCPENLHIGWDPYSDPEWIFRSWLGSYGHRANIADPNITMFGVGTYKGKWKNYEGTVAYTVDFGAK
jgi:uncharacterized protein YkwD